MAWTEKNPHSGAQRGAHFGGSVPRDKRRLYHSRAARDDRDGAFPLQRDTSAPQGELGWNRGAYDYASPLKYFRGEAFLLLPDI